MTLLSSAFFNGSDVYFFYFYFHQDHRNISDIVTTNMTLIVKAETAVSYQLRCLSLDPFLFQNSAKISVIKIL